MEKQKKRSCPHCGKLLSPEEESIACETCGAVFHRDCWQQPADRGICRPPSSIPAGSENWFIGKNGSYYRRAFEKLRKTGKPFLWNWAAFFLAPYWLFYRKMPVPGLVLLAAGFLLPKIGFAGTIFIWVLNAFCGVCGNFLYLKHIERLTARKQPAAWPMEQLLDDWRKHGSVSILAALGAFLLPTLLSLIVQMWTRLYPAILG